MLTIAEKLKTLSCTAIKTLFSCSVWHEVWSPLRCLKDVQSNEAHIDMGIPINANVEASRNHRRMHHRLPILNRVELEIEKYKPIESRKMMYLCGGMRRVATKKCSLLEELGI